MCVGSIVSPPLIAQHNGVFDEIVCKKLTVVNSKGKDAIRLISDVVGNHVVISDEAGKDSIR